MLQFPPFARGNHAPARHQRRITRPRPAHATANAGPHPATTRPNQPQPRPPGHTRSPARPTTAHRPTQRGFCTIRRTATACRRRVAPLMLQFPHSPAATTPPPATSDGSPAQRLHSPATASGQSAARHQRRSLRTPPAIQSKRNQTNSVRLNCHKPILNALEFIHEPRRWGHRSPLHPRNC